MMLSHVVGFHLETKVRGSGGSKCMGLYNRSQNESDSVPSK